MEDKLQQPFFNPEYCNNEREVETKFIVSYLLPSLGYTTEMWHQEKTENRFRLDFLAFPEPNESVSTPKIVIEAKHPHKVLKEHLPQLKKYMLELDIKYGLLTNGREIRIYRKITEDAIELIFSDFTRGIEEKIDDIARWIGRDSLIQQYVDSTKSEVDTMKKIAVYHNKGGVGKTTTVVNLAVAFAKEGKRVLIIDLDSQANSTFATGLLNFGDEAKDDLREKYVYHVLRYQDDFLIQDAVREPSYTEYSKHVHVVPSHIHLMQYEDELNRLDFTRGILLKKLRQVKDNYDVVLIDTPPSLNLYARIALITADYLLIPSDLKPFANEGLENVKHFTKEINGFKDLINLPPLEIIGILPTKISSNAKFAQGTLSNRIETVKERYQLEVLENCIIHELDDLAKCMEQTVTIGELELPDPRSIFDYKPGSKSAEEFQQFAKVVASKIGLV